MVLDALRGRLPLVVEGGFNGVDVRDVADGHVLAARRGVSGERYILGGDNVTFRDFAERVADRAGRRAPRLSVPPPVLRGAGWLAERVADHVTRRPPPITYSTVAYMAGRWLWFSTAKAERDLGYRPRPLDAAIDRSVTWFEGWDDRTR